MFDAIARRLFGSANDRYIRGLDQIIDAINALEAEVEPLSDADLAARTPWLKGRLEAGESLDDPARRLRHGARSRPARPRRAPL